jgi:hypothetical protein
LRAAAAEAASIGLEHVACAEKKMLQHATRMAMRSSMIAVVMELERRVYLEMEKLVAPRTQRLRRGEWRHSRLSRSEYGWPWGRQHGKLQPDKVAVCVCCLHRGEVSSIGSKGGGFGSPRTTVAQLVP